MSRVFISYAREDLGAAEQLYRDLKAASLNPWLDVHDLLPGMRWKNSIRQIIEDSRHLVALMSTNSVNKKGYVQRELSHAVEVLQEHPQDQIFIIPARLEDCKPHPALADLHWVDLFPSYESGLRKILAAIDESNELGARKALELSPKSSLASALDKARDLGIYLLSSPYHRPFQYIGMSVREAAEEVGGTPNEARNIVVESDQALLFLEVEGNFVNYVDVQIKETAPCSQSQEFDSEPILGILSINPSELQLARKRTHFHTYYDHRRKLKVSVSCDYDGGPLSVGFSSKYYGM